MKRKSPIQTNALVKHIIFYAHILWLSNALLFYPISYELRISFNNCFLYIKSKLSSMFWVREVVFDNYYVNIEEGGFVHQSYKRYFIPTNKHNVTITNIYSLSCEKSREEIVSSELFSTVKIWVCWSSWIGSAMPWKREGYEKKNKKITRDVFMKEFDEWKIHEYFINRKTSIRNTYIEHVKHWAQTI